MDTESKASNLPGSWEWPEDIPRERRPYASSANERKPETQNQSNSSSTGSAGSSSGGTRQSGPSATASNQRRKHWGPRTCRICLETVLPTFHPPSENIPGFLQPGPRVSYDSEGGRLIRPCKCKGSVKYVHEDCLQHWRHADPAYGARNYYHCPTCGFKYKLSRLGWANLITSVAAQITLTILIFVTTIFILGFIADPIINFCLDPTGSVFRLLGYYEPIYYYPDDEPVTWIEHFTKGFASLGLASFLKAMLASPIQFWFRSSGYGGGRGRGTTGRDRLSNTTWLVIIIGALTFMYAVWKGVRTWSKRTLEKAGERVLDVQGDDDGDDDDN